MSDRQTGRDDSMMDAKGAIVTVEALCPVCSDLIAKQPSSVEYHPLRGHVLVVVCSDCGERLLVPLSEILRGTSDHASSANRS